MMFPPQAPENLLGYFQLDPPAPPVKTALFEISSEN
jgi:hypothetical protein